MTKRYVRKDGAIVWAEIAVSLLRRTDGSPLHFITGILDVTERRRTEEALAASRSRYAELYESLGDGIVSSDSKGTILEFNEAYRRMLGYTAEELRAMTYKQFTPERWHAQEARLLEEAVRTLGTAVTYEKEYRRKDGTVFPIELRVFIQYAEGRPVRNWTIVRDISGRGPSGNSSPSPRAWRRWGRSSPAWRTRSTTPWAERSHPTPSRPRRWLGNAISSAPRARTTVPRRPSGWTARSMPSRTPARGSDGSPPS